MDGDLTQVPDGSGRERVDDDGWGSVMEWFACHIDGGRWERLERQRLERQRLERQQRLRWLRRQLQRLQQRRQLQWLQQRLPQQPRRPQGLMWLAQQLPPLLHFFNRELASAAVDGGELMTGGIQLYDGGVGRGDGIGNGFGANDQELSSASINGQLSTTYVPASDYYRYVRTENGEVHFHMNPFVYLDGRVYNRTQEPHLNNVGSSQLINKVMLGMTGEIGVALMVASLNDNSLRFLPAFNLIVAVNTVGFVTAMISMLLRTRNPWASGVLSIVGAVAGSSAVIFCLVLASVLFGQT